jgi:hypothetical protein
MPHTTKDVFLKCWLWSIISSIVIAVVFVLLTSIGNVFRWEYGGAVFIDLLFGLSVVGSYIGAGYVGWCIVVKYYPDTAKHFLRQYRLYSVLSSLVFVVVVYSPLSILAFLWSILAPGCVLVALSKSRKLTREASSYR